MLFLFGVLLGPLFCFSREFVFIFGEFFGNVRLERRLGIGLGKKHAQRIEHLVNARLRRPVVGQSAIATKEGVQRAHSASIKVGVGKAKKTLNSETWCEKCATKNRKNYFLLFFLHCILAYFTSICFNIWMINL